MRLYESLDDGTNWEEITYSWFNSQVNYLSWMVCVYTDSIEFVEQYPYITSFDEGTIEFEDTHLRYKMEWNGADAVTEKEVI